MCQHFLQEFVATVLEDPIRGRRNSGMYRRSPRVFTIIEQQPLLFWLATVYGIIVPGGPL